ncbi:unnamed protein product [Spirodela intermedia]|uniref:Alpha/beta hydrolase fold-3 domain-containing protein n=2 Tax=Spirodela intermedia TaxID=51605 RepID=A0A7I8IQN3_SPIIN|nr:unnamed protein product [Spirodela intermedia]CAA6660191.1 unnamed protein product [Spirodela intermedia]CAA7396513.1 unnamed protein product [Spirodela intermedia]
MSYKRSTVFPSLPCWTKLQVALLSIGCDYVRRPDGTLNRRLVSLVDFKAGPNPNPVCGIRTADVTLDPVRGLWIRLFLPASDGGAGRAALPLVVFFHGGGFAFLSAASQEYDAVCRRICSELPVAVVSVNYRLSPEHRFPAQYDDGVDVLHFLESKDDVPGGDVLRDFFEAADLSNCFLTGDCAGANIAHHVARRWTAGERPSQGRIRLAGLVAIQPFFGGEERVDSEIRLPRGPVVTTDRTDWLWKAFLPHGATRDHEAANPEAATTDLGESFPPVVVMVGEFDPLLDWQLKYFRSLRLRGKEAEIIEYAGAIHAFYLFPDLRRSGVLIEDLRGFILRETHRPKQGGAVDAAAT